MSDYIPPGWVRMDHPDTEGTALVSQQAFDEMWAPLGWVIVASPDEGLSGGAVIGYWGTEAELDLADPTLTDRRIAYAHDTNVLKIGPGLWSTLPVFSSGGGGGALTGPAGGSLSGTYPNPALSAAKQAEIDAKITIVQAAIDDTAVYEAARNRANHQGNQAQSTIVGLLTDLSDRLLKSGDTMTGDLILPGDPDSPLKAAPKQYVDAIAAALGSYMELVAADPTEVDLSPAGSMLTIDLLATIARSVDLGFTNGLVTTLLARLPVISALASDSAGSTNNTDWIDSGLEVTLAVKNYLLSGFVPYFSDATADIEFRWAGTATVGGFYTMFGPGTAGAGSESTIKNLTVGMGVTTTLGGGGAGRCSALPHGRVRCTAGGTLRLEFRQVNTNASPTNIETDAIIRLEPET